MVRFLLRDTSVHVLCDGSGEEFMETNVVLPQRDRIGGTFFNISLEKNLRTLRHS